MLDICGVQSGSIRFHYESGGVITGQINQTSRKGSWKARSTGMLS